MEDARAAVANEWAALVREVGTARLDAERGAGCVCESFHLGIEHGATA